LAADVMSKRLLETIIPKRAEIAGQADLMDGKP
jgi:hypothetical protein